MQINTCIKLKYFKSLSAHCLGLTGFMLLFLQYFIFMAQNYAMILLQQTLCKTARRSFSWNLFLIMVFKFPIDDVHYFKAKIFGNYLLFNFSDGSNNK